MDNPSIEPSFAICHSASFSSYLSITIKKNKLFKEEKFQITNRYQLQWRKYAVQSTLYISVTIKKTCYSNYKIGINYNEENKLFKVQKRCVFLILRKWSFTLHGSRIKFKVLQNFIKKNIFYKNMRQIKGILL